MRIDEKSHQWLGATVSSAGIDKPIVVSSKSHKFVIKQALKFDLRTVRPTRMNRLDRIWIKGDGDLYVTKYFMSLSKRLIVNSCFYLFDLLDCNYKFYRTFIIVITLLMEKV